MNLPKKANSQRPCIAELEKKQNDKHTKVRLGDGMARGSKEKFLKAMAHVGSQEPEAHDKL